MSDQEQQDRLEDEKSDDVEAHALDKKASDDDGDDVEAHAMDKHR